jgi:hypothetical protein
MILAISFIFLSGNQSYATTYYLANNGKDSNNGTSITSPWQSISMLNSALSQMKPGDNVLFHCNDVFEGEIVLPAGLKGSPSNPITLGSYGTGKKPVITGSVSINDWQLYKPNIWKTTLSSEHINQVFDGDKRLTPARMPNKGYYRVGMVTGNKGFIDSKLSQETNYWKNSTVVCLLNEWYWIAASIDSSNANGYIKFINKDSVFNSINEGNGYYLQNKFELLDSADEWFFDEATKNLFIYSYTDPNNKNIRASVYTNGIKTNWPWDVKYFIIQDIEFRQQAKEALSLYGENFIIRQCLIRQAGLYGIYINRDWQGYSRDNLISYNRIEDCLGSGINTYHFAQSTLEYNNIRKCALIPAPDGPKQFVGAQNGITLLAGDSLIIRYNHIDSIGASGIDMESNYSLIEKNIIEHSMLILSDGAGFYNNNGHHNIFRNNIFRFTVGNMDASRNNASRFTKELYFDMGNHENNIVENNTFQSQANNAGIGIAWTSNNINIRNNTIYQCLRGLEILNYDPINKPVKNLNICRNTFYTNIKNARPYWINTWNGFSPMYSKCDSNYLCNPFSDEIVEHISGPNISYLNFSQWKQSSGADSHSILSFYRWIYPTDSSFIIVNEKDSVVKYTFAKAVRDLDNNAVYSTVLGPYSSRVFVGSNSNINSEVVTGFRNAQYIFKEFSAYPNPTDDVLHIQLPYTDNPEIIKLFDLTGRLVYQSFFNKQLDLDSSKFPEGLYVLDIGRHAKKILVKHQ